MGATSIICRRAGPWPIGSTPRDQITNLEICLLWTFDMQLVLKEYGVKAPFAQAACWYGVAEGIPFIRLGMYPGSARKHFDQWYAWAIRWRLEPVKQLALERARFAISKIWIQDHRRLNHYLQNWTRDLNSTFSLESPLHDDRRPIRYVQS